MSAALSRSIAPAKSNLVCRLLCPAALAVVTIGAGCGSETGTKLDGRLWVSGIPTSRTEPISAFVFRSGQDRDGDPAGLLFRGTAYRGTHDVARWHATGSGRGVLTLLADSTRYSIRFESCKPSRGFDHCIVLRGGPGNHERFQSRKRWAIGKKSLPDASPHVVFDQLATDVFAADLDDENEPVD